MDPVTHIITGIAVSKVMGVQMSITDPVFTAVVLGSVFPDTDILLQKWGHYVYLKNHRGFTHSIIGILLSALLLTVLLGLIYKDFSYFKILVGILIGMLSHIFLDLQNSYGAKFLWPFYKKKITVSLFIVFDPIYLSLILSFIFIVNLDASMMVVSLLISYVLLRMLMKGLLYLEIERLIDKGKIRIYPSLTNLFKWNFVLDDSETFYVGQKNYITGKFSIRKRFKKYDKNKFEFVLNSRVGSFFRDFTPVFHVAFERIGDFRKYTFFDLRYQVKDSFLHHAQVEYDKNDNIVSANFSPYSLDRKIEVPQNGNRLYEYINTHIRK